MRLKRRLLGWAVSGTIVLCAVFLPELLSGGWHFLSGGRASYGDFHIEVPFGWLANSQNDLLVIWRLRRLYLWDSPPTIAITDLQLPPDFEIDESKHTGTWKEKEARSLGENGFAVVGDHTYETGRNKTTCVEAREQNSSTRVRVRCLRLPEKIYILFEGKQVDLSAFYVIIQRLN